MYDIRLCYNIRTLFSYLYSHIIVSFYSIDIHLSGANPIEMPDIYVSAYKYIYKRKSWCNYVETSILTMAVLDAYPRFTGPQGRTIAWMIGGTSLFVFTSMMLLRDEIKEHRGNVAVHEPSPGPYITKDAIAVVARPAKNANVKGSMPSASQWV
ncbi:hypothetical protein BJ165DRAFT_731129 [Panaeolus papilionaceus]|nr:hypothetical protein BJ165DRAFT_731129 [Panaeolus papilionaceus]